MRASTVVISCAGLMMSAAAWGRQEQGGSPGKTAPEAVLAGPTVDEGTVATTLIERDETGRVRRLDVPPAEAALALVDLDAETRAKVDAVLDRRRKALDRLVRDNLPLLVGLSNARASRDEEGTKRALRELYERAAPLREKGSLQDELVGVLPVEKAAALKALVQEYTLAVFAEARQAVEQSGDEEAMTDDDAAPRTGERGRRAALGRAAQAEMLAAVGREIKRSYDRVVTAAVEDFDALIKKLELDPEQEAEVRRIAIDHFQKSEGKPTAAQKGEVFARIYAKLTREQRRTLIAELGPRR